MSTISSYPKPSLPSETANPQPTPFSTQKSSQSGSLLIPSLSDRGEPATNKSNLDVVWTIYADGKDSPESKSSNPSTVTAAPRDRRWNPDSAVQSVVVEVTSAAGPVISAAKSAEAKLSSTLASLGSARRHEQSGSTGVDRHGLCRRPSPG